MDEAVITGEVLLRLQRSERSIVCNVSNRHAHLTQEHIEKLFGPGYRLSRLRDLVQPGEYAAEETLTLKGPKGKIEKVRILGPPREFSQLEISRTDTYTSGIKAPLRISGDIQGSSGGWLIGPHGSVQLTQGIIVARRHIHMTPRDADFFKVKDRQYVRVRTSPPRSVVFEDVLVRVSPDYRLEFHVDTDEANACDLKSPAEVFLS